LAYKTLVLRDPNRRPADWNDQLTDGQRAVFLSDVRGGGELTVEGSPAQRSSPSCCLVFDSLEEAKTFCRELVGRVEHMRCDVYDRRGAAVGPVCRFVGKRFQRRLPTARSARLMVIGGCMLILICPVLFRWDWLYRGVLIFPTLLGINCILGALRLFHLGHSTFQAARRTDQETIGASNKEE
jgi:hypothetical protein